MDFVPTTELMLQWFVGFWRCDVDKNVLKEIATVIQYLDIYLSLE